MNCKFCDREINNKGSLAAHEKCCKSNPDRMKHRRSPNAGAKKGCVTWNKGLNKKDPRVAKNGKAISVSASVNRRPGRPWTEEQKKKASERAIAGNYGGYIPGSGRGKSGRYKGIWCDSSWELAYVIYCMENGISIQRNKEKRSYEFNGATKTYIPDFLVEQHIVEIKGYKTEEWMAKLTYNPDIKVLYEEEMKPILDYVIAKYGKDYIKLYGMEHAEVGSSN
jgi:hypothetical protein